MSDMEVQSYCTSRLQMAQGRPQPRFGVLLGPLRSGVKGRYHAGAQRLGGSELCKGPALMFMGRGSTWGNTWGPSVFLSSGCIRTGHTAVVGYFLVLLLAVPLLLHAAVAPRNY